MSAWLYHYGNEATQELVSGRNDYDRFGSFLSNHQEIMESLLNLQKFAPKSRRYSVESLRTDGVSVSILLRIVMTDEEAARFNGGGDDEDVQKGNLTFADDNDNSDGRSSVPLIDGILDGGCRVIGVDPGRRDIYTSAEPARRTSDGIGGNRRHDVRHYSSGRWLHDCGASKARVRTNNWIRKAGLSDWNNNMPTHKVSSVSAFIAYMRYVLQQLHPFMELMLRKRSRNQRFTNYIKRQKALSRMVNTMVKPRNEEDKGKPIVISFGAARFGTCGPQKTLAKELKKRRDVTVVDMDEHRTSMLCSKCAYNLPEEADVIEEYMEGK